MQVIRIGEIRIRFRGVPLQRAQASLAGIENDITTRIGRYYGGGTCRDKRLDNTMKIDAGTVDCQPEDTPDRIRARIADRVAGIIRRWMV